MPDLTAIATAIQSFKTVSEMAKAIKQSTTSLEDANINFQIADLTNALADLKMSLADVKEENANLREQISSLIKADKIRSLLIIRDNVYWAEKTEIEGYGKGPWCSSCFDEKEILVSLHHKMSMAIGDHVSYKWECPSCKSSIGAPHKNKL